MVAEPLPPVPVITVCSLDVVLRGSATAGLVCDAPGAVVVQYDLGDATTAACATGTDRSCGGDCHDGRALRRTVFTGTGVLESVEVDPGHGCLTCALLADVPVTLTRLAGRRPGLLVLALPVAVEPLPVVRALRNRAQRLRASAVVTVADGASFEEDLFGDATLRERGLAVAEDDERAVGETLAHLVEFGDALITAQALTARTDRLVAHLGGPGHRIRALPLHQVDPWALTGIDRPAPDPRGDLQSVAGPGVADGDGIWTLDLTADRPVHPGRLLERIEDLGAGRLRSRGHLWLASRPEVACAWDGAGGQLSIGSLGPWSRPPARTRLIVTGTGPVDRERVAAAFDAVVLTATEHRRGATRWRARGDELAPWLGEPDDGEQLTG